MFLIHFVVIKAFLETRCSAFLNRVQDRLCEEKNADKRKMGRNSLFRLIVHTT